MTRRTTAAMLDFLTPVSVVPGTGPKRIAALQESGITTVGDLLYRFPRRYLDRSYITPLGELHRYIDEGRTVCGTVDTVRFERGRRSRLRAKLTDESGSIELLWFQGVSFYRHSLKKGQRIIATGKVSRFSGLQMVHPLFETVPAGSTGAPVPVLPLYGLSGAMREATAGQRYLQKSMQWLFKNLKHYPQSLPEVLVKRHSFPPLETCLRELHFPTDCSQLDRYRERLRYEELYRLALTLHFSRKKFQLPGRPVNRGALLEQFLKTLPFTLTEDQHGAVDILVSDCAAPHRMHRLLQGDVGSGKTVVAFAAALPALAAGLQVVWMAPTEILAVQTWNTVSAWLAPLGYTADLFTAATASGKEHLQHRQQIASGTARFIVGTHALLQPSVAFHAVGLVVIDEQHRFGARQRLELHGKDDKADFLMLSATPIPQTLASTLYGDLDLITLHTLPPGRLPIATHLVPDEKRGDMEQFIKERLDAGEQCYYIVPRIDEDETEEESGSSRRLRSLDTTFAELTKGAFSGIPAAFMHGKVESAEKERILGEFLQGTIRLLVATTVLEVGIDAQHATVIVIENSERFGLAQLHQLRGRVGRGNRKSYCFLLSDPAIPPETRVRLQKFSREHDGFAVAEMDLQQRGPGEVSGYKQSGWDDLVFADILRDAPLFSEIRNEISEFLSRHSGK